MFGPSLVNRQLTNHDDARFSHNTFCMLPADSPVVRAESAFPRHNWRRPAATVQSSQWLVLLQQWRDELQHVLCKCKPLLQQCLFRRPGSRTNFWLSESSDDSRNWHNGAKGVIVLHGGDGGVSPESFALTDAYFKAGYEVVQVAWWDDWEMLSDPMTGPGNIQHAACRPATFLNYIYTSIYLPMIAPGGVNGSAAMCALGDSAGSAAIAYSLAYYGAGNWLDNVEMLSGPVLSDIEQGCEIPKASSVTVCSPSSPNQGWGCQLGSGGSTWTLLPEYVGGAQTGVQKWTNDLSCAGSGNTSSGSNSNWLKESIVDQGTGASPTFVYSKTSMSAWLCRSVYNRNGVSYNCGATNNGNSNYCPNNSSPQGQIFYQNIPYLTPNFSVYAVDACGNAEAVGSGNVLGYAPQVFNGTVTGITAITDDMVGVPPVIPAMCIRRH